MFTDGIRNVRRSSTAALGLVLSAGFAAAALAQAPAPAPAIPVGIKVPVVLVGTYTSETAHVGDTFSFKTTKEEKLGDAVVPAGTPGHGRLAVVQKAEGKQHGNLSLQADSIDLPDGRTIWVNIDTDKPPTGRLSKRHTTPVVLPFVGAVVQTTSGDLVLDSGIPFGVVTILPRRMPAPLLTAPPTPEPSPSPMKPGAMTTPAAPAESSPPPEPATPPALPAPAVPSPVASGH
jgi:hypothetical protein